VKRNGSYLLIEELLPVEQQSVRKPSFFVVLFSEKEIIICNAKKRDYYVV